MIWFQVMPFCVPGTSNSPACPEGPPFGRKKKAPFHDDGPEPTIELARLISVMPSVADDVSPTHNRPHVLELSHQAL